MQKKKVTSATQDAQTANAESAEKKEYWANRETGLRGQGEYPRTRKPILGIPREGMRSTKPKGKRG